jgi:hypothetical protein
VPETGQVVKTPLLSVRLLLLLLFPLSPAAVAPMTAAPAAEGTAVPATTPMRDAACTAT